MQENLATESTDSIDEVMMAKSKADLLYDSHDNFDPQYEEKLFEGLDNVLNDLVSKDKTNSGALILKKASVKNR